MFLVVVLYALLASTFILAKKALTYADPCFLIGFRMLCAGTILLFYYFFKNNKITVPHRQDAWLFIKTALFHIYFAFILEFWALQYISALKANLVYSASPFIAAILGYPLLHEYLSLSKVAGILLGLCGLLPVILTASTDVEFSLEFGRISLPEVVLFIAVISSTYAWFLVKRLMHKGYHLSLINGFSMLTGGFLSMITAFIFESPVSAVHDWQYFLLWITLLIVVANLIVYNLYGWLLQRYSITFLTLAGFLCPSFGVIYEWLFMNGHITWHYFVSILFVGGGLALFHMYDKH